MEEEKVDVQFKDGHLNPKLFNGIFTKNFLNFLNTINKKEDSSNIIDKMSNWMIENTFDNKKEFGEALQDMVFLYAIALVNSIQAYQKFNDIISFSEYTKK